VRYFFQEPSVPWCSATSALEQWYLDGGIHPIDKYVEEGMRPLRSIWAAPDEPDSP
jgi:hypothetical protein